MTFHPGDMVRLNEEAYAYVTKSVEAARMMGTVIKSRKREHRGPGRVRRLGIITELSVVDMVEVMWSNGSVQTIDGRYLEKITARLVEQEKKDG